MHCWSARLIGLPPGKFVADEFPVVALLAFCGSEQGAREDGLRRIPCWPGSGHRMNIEVAVRTYRGGAQQRWHRLSGNGSSSSLGRSWCDMVVALTPRSAPRSEEHTFSRVAQAGAQLFGLVEWPF